VFSHHFSVLWDDQPKSFVLFKRRKSTLKYFTARHNGKSHEQAKESAAPLETCAWDYTQREAVATIRQLGPKEFDRYNKNRER